MKAYHLVQFTLGVATAGLLVFASGCQTGSVRKQGFDFSHYRTFAIRPLPTTGTHHDPSIAVRLAPSARQAIEETLSSKGFQQAPQNDADFQVNLVFDYHGEGEESRYELRRLKIEIIDSKSNEVVWSDSKQRMTEMTMRPDAVQQRIAEILKGFPP